MISTEKTLEDITFTLNQEIHVKAPLDTTFAALLEQLGPGNETHEGKSLHLKIEAWPGGRWYRDLGDGNGHFWAVVRPSSGPRCWSSPARSSPPSRWSTTCNTG